MKFLIKITFYSDSAVLIAAFYIFMLLIFVVLNNENVTINKSDDSIKTPKRCW